MNSLNKHLLLEENGWDKISCSRIKDWKKKGCPTKEVAGSCYVNKTKCKSKPTPEPPKPVNPKPEPKKPEPKKNDITDCDWKPSEGMYFRCNDSKDCDVDAGDFFRRYVNKQFPEIAKKYNLEEKGSETLDYCNSTMKKVWNHVYDSDESPGLKGETIGSIFSNNLKPETIIIDCKPWETDNYFIKDYPKEDERDDAAFKMVVAFNQEYKYILDSRMIDQCDKTIDNDLYWAQNNKKDLHKNPTVKWIANVTPTKGKKWYDEWKEKTSIKNESVMNHLIERKLKIKKKLKEMKKNKTISENVREKLKISKLDRKLNLKENSKYFFNESYRKFFDNYFNTKVLNNLNESELEDFDIAFNSVFGGHEESFIEKGIQYILNKLQIDPNSDMGKKISERFKSLPKEDAKKMIDPQYVSETIVSILPETFINVSDPSGDGLETIVKNTIAKLAASRTTLDDLTHQISQKVKQSLEDLKNTTIETSTDMKNSYIEKLKNSL
jgi:hypothetical protein